MNDSPISYVRTRELVESRNALRRQIRLPCEIVSHYGDDPFVHFIGDLSEDGAWIDTLFPLHPMAELVLCFEPPGIRRELMVFARVARVVTGRRRGDRGPRGMGLELLDLTAAERRGLAQCLRGLAPRSPAQLRRPVPARDWCEHLAA